MIRRYATPAAFGAALEARLKAAAAGSGRPINALRRQYLTQRFLARVYVAPNAEWILLGGAALLARIPGARHSQDIDFSRPVDLDTAVSDLGELIHATPAPDPFGFDIKPDPANSDDHHLRLKITVRLGASVIDTFPVDITYRPAITAVDTVQPNPVILIEACAGYGPNTAVTARHRCRRPLIAAEIGRLVGTAWTNEKGFSKPLTVKDFMVVAPYNDQVRTIRARLDADVSTRGVPVGIVDKFQGREAAVVFFSMTTSTGEDMPRGADFLFSRNRLNVAISRARCLAHLVCTEELLNTRARDVDDMRLIATLNAVVKYVQTGRVTRDASR